MDLVRIAATNTIRMAEEAAVMVEVAKEVDEDVDVAVVVEEDHKEEEKKDPVAEAAEPRYREWSGYH